MCPSCRQPLAAEISGIPRARVSLDEKAFPLDFPFVPLVGVGDFVVEGWKLFFANFRAIAMITLVLYVPVYCVQNLIVYSLGLQESLHVLWIAMIPALIVGSLSAPAVFYANAVFLREHRQAEVGESLTWGLKKWLPMLLATVVIWSLTWAGMVLLIIPGLYLTAKYGVAQEALSLEGLKPMAALRRSASLTEGVKGEFLIVFFVQLCIMLAIVFMVGVFTGLYPRWWTTTLSDVIGALLGQAFPCTFLLFYLTRVKQSEAKAVTPP